MIKRLITWSALLAALAAALLAYQTAKAQDPTPSDDEVNAVASRLYCPVCENISLDVCPTTACEQWRGLIREKLAAGWSEQQIKDFFAQQYGDRVLEVPPKRGLNWLVYVLPPLIVLAGAVLVGSVLRRMHKSAVQAAGVTNPAEEAGAAVDSSAGSDYVRQLEEELRKRKAA